LFSFFSSFAHSHLAVGQPEKVLALAGVAPLLGVQLATHAHPPPLHQSTIKDKQQAATREGLVGGLSHLTHATQKSDMSVSGSDYKIFALGKVRPMARDRKVSLAVQY
jgi:hypothetical protein